MSPTKTRSPTIVIDTREQRPYTFDGVPTVRRALATGDYSVEGLESRVAVERKSKADAYQCCGGKKGANRIRFVACLERLAEIDRPAIVIECSFREFCRPPRRTRITPSQAVGSYLSWSAKYRLPIFWCPDRSYAERVTLRWLVAFVKHVGPKTRRTYYSPLSTRFS